MSANYYGNTTYHCYNECRQEGCPGHRIRLGSKYGCYFAEILDESGKPAGGRIDLPDIGMFNALCRIWNKDLDP